MIIANPIYDVVFKYLLEDLEISRGLLSTILGEEIESISLQPQETATEIVAGNISVLRFDFKAIIKSQTGEHKKILIELQKVKQVFDIMRFRRYLGDNYQKEDEIKNKNGVIEKHPLPIVSIYLLGFLLDNITSAVVKINREYRDVTTQELIAVKEDFVELLTHDCYLIQLRQLKGKTRTKLERILQVFNPEFQTEDSHKLDFMPDVKDPLLKKMVDRLGRAIASEKIRNIMDVEDEIERTFERGYRKLSAEKDKEIETERQKADLERQKADLERQKNEELLRQIEELKKVRNTVVQDEIERTFERGYKKLTTEKDKEIEFERQKAETERQKNEELQKQIEQLKKQFKK